MNSLTLEKQIKKLLYFLLGIIFTIMFIFISTIIDFSHKSMQVQKKQVQSLILDGVSIRERLIFEDFMTANYHSLSHRIKAFLEDQNIRKFEISVFDLQKCVYKTGPSCAKRTELPKTITNTEILDKFIISLPLRGWSSNQGLVLITIPLNQVSEDFSVLKTLFLYVLPFMGLVILAFFLYRYFETHHISPAIKRIIEAEKISTQKEMISQFAHDIRSPLSVLGIAVDHLDSDLTSSKLLINSAADRIEQISNALLVQNKKLHADAARGLDVGELIRELIRDKKTEFAHRPFDIAVKTDDDLVEFNLNHSDVYRCLSNLFNNAIESVPEDRRPAICIEAKLIDSMLSVSVSDNGCGINETVVPKILDGNFTTKENGNGLGLSGCVKWAKTKNGIVTINSRMGLGTTVVLSIPDYHAEVLC